MCIWRTEQAIRSPDYHSTSTVAALIIVAARAKLNFHSYL